MRKITNLKFLKNLTMTKTLNNLNKTNHKTPLNRFFKTNTSSFSSTDILQSKIDTSSQEFLENNQNIENQVSMLNYHIMKILECGGQKSNDRHVSRGKYMVRERIDKILDEG